MRDGVPHIFLLGTFQAVADLRHARAARVMNIFVTHIEEANTRNLLTFADCDGYRLQDGAHRYTHPTSDHSPTQPTRQITESGTLPDVFLPAAKQTQSRTTRKRPDAFFITGHNLRTKQTTEIGFDVTAEITWDWLYDKNTLFLSAVDTVTVADTMCVGMSHIKEAFAKKQQYLDDIREDIITRYDELGLRAPQIYTVILPVHFLGFPLNITKTELRKMNLKSAKAYKAFTTELSLSLLSDTHSINSARQTAAHASTEQANTNTQ
jgi:hypothetical protein